MQRKNRRTAVLAALFGLSLLAGLYFLWLDRGRPPPLPAGFLAADKTLGVTIDLTRYDDRSMARTLDALRANGLVWLRQPVRWSEIEAAPGRFSWQHLDRVLEAVARNNRSVTDPHPSQFRLIAVLDTTPVWARPAGSPATAPPERLSDFGDFARTLAERYGSQLDYYQIWHEPNLSAGWGNRFVDPAGYAGLLREGALNIREADTGALILSGALAPTLENGPLNLNELDFLEQLYQARAERWFDIVAGQAYGFDFDPADPARVDVLNFRRLELLRQVMLAHGDIDTPIWATAFGWNALPPDWPGRPSPWRSDQDRTDPAALQIQRTAAALRQARLEWPWLGPMLAIRWDNDLLAVDDPARGFALTDLPLMQAAFRRAASRTSEEAPPGRYPANHPSGRYSGGWRFGQTEADIPRQSPASLVIPFYGTRLDLSLNKGPYRGFLTVSIDGLPSTALPLDNQGRSYVMLYDPLRSRATVTVAENLEPGPHRALLQAEGGWGQWALGGWTVHIQTNPGQISRIGLLISILTALISGLVLIRLWKRPPEASVEGRVLSRWRIGGYYLDLSERRQILILAGLAAAFLLAPNGMALILFFPLALVILLRPDLGLALTAFNLSFFLVTKALPLGIEVHPVESTLYLAAAGFAWREVPRYASREGLRFLASRLTTLDLAALSLLALAYVATLTAVNFGVSMYEWRTLVFGSILAYFLVRLGQDYGPADSNRPGRWAWRLTDAFVAGAVLHAVLALALYFFSDQVIIAEGVQRAIGPVYSSPNNLSLYLGRVWPILIAVALFPGRTASGEGGLSRGYGSAIRPVLYGLAAVIVTVTLILTFSKGALLLGLPASLLAMGLFYLLRQRPRPWWRVIAVVGSWMAATAAVLLLFARTERFRATLDASSGSTLFFRLKLWQASLNMLADRWLFGVGLNNFLTQYRTRYILPEAWQEPNLSHPHNLILDFGTRLGLGSILLLLWLQWGYWHSAWRLFSREVSPLVLGLMGSMVVFLSHGLVDNSYFLVDLAFAFFLNVGLIQGLSESDVSP